MNSFIRNITLFAGLLLVSPAIYAQQIAGTVNSKDGTLPSATITIGNISVQTDLYGKFKLDNKVIGPVNILVRYIGYMPKTIQLNAKAGLNNLGNILLEPEASSLGEIMVTGSTAASQLKALSIKKNATGIMEVLAADAIGKLPDRNAAEAVQRIQGVSIERDLGEGRYVSVRGTPIQWSSTLLNGNRLPSASGDFTDRRVQMDIFPSELIEYVQLSKAITPDIEGDAIGGAVNFTTRPAPSKRTLGINLASGYNDQARKRSYNGSLVYGDRLLNGKLGYILSGVLWDRTSANDRYNLDYNFSNPNKTQSFSIADLQLRDYIARRNTKGFNGGLEYVFNPKNKIYAKGIYSQYQDHQEVHETYFNFDAKNAQIQTRKGDYNTKMKSLELGGISNLSAKTDLDWSASIDKASFQFDNLGYPIATFKQAMQYNGLSSDGKKYLSMDAPDGVGDRIDAVLPNVQTPIDPTKMTLSQVLLLRSRNSEENKRLAANLKYAVNDQLKLKFGAKFIQKDKDVENSPFSIYLPGTQGVPAPTIAQLGTEHFPYNGGFLSEIGSPYNNVIIDQMRIKQVQDLVTPEGISKYKLLPYQIDSKDNASGATKYFTGTETVYAVYGMAEYKPVNELTIIGGIRNEYNKVTFNGSKVTSNATGKTVTPLVQDNSYNAFLPMLHFKYSPSEDNVLRLAYTRTFARPDFTNLNPATTQDDVNRIISKGNAELKPTFSSNFDLMAEHYFGGIGIVNVGAFYKKLSNLIYNNQSTSTINNLLYTVTEPDNLQNAWMMGLEAGFVKRFTELPGFWKGFGIEGNYTFTNSEVKIPRFANGIKTEDKTVIPKQAKHIFNAVLLYEYKGLSMRIAGNYKGKYLDAIRQEAGPDHYRWYAQNFTVDYSASYAITPKIRVFAELNNLTNAPVRYYHGTFDRVEQAEWYSIRGQIGASLKVF